MNKKQLPERDICTKYTMPALEKAGRAVTTQVREEFPLIKGYIVVRGKLHPRNLDCKNPREVEVDHRDPEGLMAECQQIVHQLEAAQAALKAELMACLGGKA